MIRYNNRTKTFISDISGEELCKNATVDAWLYRIISGEPIQHVIRDIYCEGFDDGFDNRIGKEPRNVPDL